MDIFKQQAYLYETDYTRAANRVVASSTHPTGLLSSPIKMVILEWKTQK
jgi:hypothetical protein